MLFLYWKEIQRKYFWKILRIIDFPHTSIGFPPKLSSYLVFKTTLPLSFARLRTNLSEIPSAPRIFRYYKILQQCRLGQTSDSPFCFVKIILRKCYVRARVCLKLRVEQGSNAMLDRNSIFKNFCSTTLHSLWTVLNHGRAELNFFPLPETGFKIKNISMWLVGNVQKIRWSACAWKTPRP